MQNLKNLSREKLIALSAIIAAFLYIFFSPLNWTLYELILFPCPDFRTPDVNSKLHDMTKFGINASEVEFRSLNGRTLHGIYLSNSRSKRVFLFNHTKGNNIYAQLEKARCLCVFDASVLLYDYQGFGRSEGRMSVEASCDDAIAAYDYLVKEKHFAANKIIAVGQSFGSGVTGYLCTRRELAGVIMLSGFSSLLSTGRKTLPWLHAYPDSTFLNHAMDNTAVFSKSHPPLLIVHGDQDNIIPVEEAHRLYDRAIEPKKLLILHGGHCSFGDGQEFNKCLAAFLAKYRI